MAEKKRIGKINPIFEAILRKILKQLFKNLFRVRLDLPNEVNTLKPPFILLPNHQGFWDPFLVGVYLRDPVYYITSDAVFRSRFLDFLLKFLGAIPKTKSQSDLDALKHIFDMKDQGRNIGIFAEGQRNWSGLTLPLIKSTSKLIRMLRLPVVTAVIKGGFFSHPRWGTSIRTGGLLIEYRLLFGGDEVGSMKVSEIHDKLTGALSFDEVEYQKQQKIEYKGNRFAENIEQFLFTCPECGSMDGLYSYSNSFKCLKCGKEWKIDSYQTISASDGNTMFDNVRDWDEWQLKKLHERIDYLFGTGEVIFDDGGLRINTGYKSRRLKRFISGSLKLTSLDLSMCDKHGKEVLEIPVREINGINVQNREILDLYYNSVLYAVRDPRRRFSSYKWWRAVDYLQREKLGLNLPD